MSGPLPLLLGLLLVLASAVLWTVWLRPERATDAAVWLGVLAVVHAAGGVLLAGGAGLLRPEVLLAVHAAAVVPPALLARRAGPAATAQALGARLRPRRPALWQAALVALAAGALAWQLLVALVLPPYAYDALTYHLTTVAGWVRGEDLAPSSLSLCCAYYPHVAELVTAWPVVLLGHDGAVGTVQVAAALLAAAAVAGLARSAGLSRGSAAAAAALFVLTPALLAQVPTSYVDVLLAALALAALHALVRLATTARPGWLVLTGLCAGLLSGTKGTGLVWAAALVLTAGAVAVVLVRGDRLAAAAAARGLAVVVGCCLLLGAPWYLRAALATGNPVHPVRLEAFGRVLADGPLRLSEVLTPSDAGAAAPWPVAVARSWAADLLPWRHGSYDYQQRSGGLGPVWSWLGAPLLAASVVVLARRRSALLWAAAPVLAVLLVQPYRWWARFTLPLGALGALAVVAVVAGLPRPALRRGLQAATLGLAAAGTALVLVEVDPAARAEPLPASRVLALVGAPEQERDLARLFHPEYAFLDAVPERAVVVVDLRAAPLRFVYPLFGPRLTRDVRPAGAGPPPRRAWVVTAEGRPLDAAMLRERGRPASDVGGVRAWAPAP